MQVSTHVVTTENATRTLVFISVQRSTSGIVFSLIRSVAIGV